LITVKKRGQPFFLHGVCMSRECTYGECAHKQHVRTLTLTHTITAAYSVSGNVIRVRILICATRQKPCRVYQKSWYGAACAVSMATTGSWQTTAVCK